MLSYHISLIFMLQNHSNPEPFHKPPSLTVTACPKIAGEIVYGSSHIYKYLISSFSCLKQLRSEGSFTISDTAIRSYQLKIKDALDNSWLEPDLNSHRIHTILTLSL